jgi:iron complex outermembrane receptor protein
MGYLSGSTGYKGGGVNPRPFYPAQILGFTPEELTTYEVGVKSDLGQPAAPERCIFYNDYKTSSST